MGPLFLTGATGFVGRRLLERLPSALYSDIRCLTRDPERLPASRAGGARWEAVLVEELEAPEAVGERVRSVLWVEREPDLALAA